MWQGRSVRQATIKKILPQIHFCKNFYIVGSCRLGSRTIIIVVPTASIASNANTAGLGPKAKALIVMPVHNMSSAVSLVRRDTPRPFS